jgi:hypothetical protein
VSGQEQAPCHLKKAAEILNAMIVATLGFGEVLNPPTKNVPMDLQPFHWEDSFGVSACNVYVLVVW